MDMQAIIAIIIIVKINIIATDIIIMLDIILEAISNKSKNKIKGENEQRTLAEN
jgi:hypothetical protein